MYKFIKTIDPENKFEVSNVYVIIPHNDTHIGDLVLSFKEFLLACGYQQGSIDDEFGEVS